MEVDRKKLSNPGMRQHTRSPGYRSLRKGRWSEPGGLYLVTTVTYRRRRWFTDWDLASRVSATLDSTQTWEPHARLLCWVLMPDHWHGLLELEGNGMLSAALGRAKGRSARFARTLMANEDPLWAPGFHDSALRREHDILETARYIIANPVRAGLVTSVRQYLYWNAIWL